jgi:maltose-binding protein MalE
MLLPNRWVGTLASDDILLPLDDYIPADEQRRLLPAAVAGARHAAADGQQRLYGLPVSVDTLALFYNADNFPEPPADTATMFSAARALSDPSAVPPRWGHARLPVRLWRARLRRAGAGRARLERTPGGRAVARVDQRAQPRL